MNKKYVFILGVPRSGTTVLAKLLASFSNTSYLPYSFKILEKYGLQNNINLALKMAIISKKINCFDLNWDNHFGGNNIWHRFLSIKDYSEKKRLIDESAFQNDIQDNNIFINKRIANVNILSELANTFYNSILIHVKRDPLDTIISIKNQRLKKHNNPNVRWGVFTENMYAQFDDPIIDISWQFVLIYDKIVESKILFSKYIDIDYEELCNNPEYILNSLKNLIGFKGEISNTNHLKLVKHLQDNEIANKVYSILKNSKSEELKKYLNLVKNNAN